MRRRKRFPGLLRAMQPGERAGFCHYLASPLFNTNPSFLRFFQCLCKACPGGFGQAEIGWQAVFEKAFPGRPFTAHKLHQLHSEMSRLLEHFFVVKEEAEQPHDSPRHQFRVCMALAQRGSMEAFQSAAGKLLQQLEKSPGQNREELLLRQQICHWLYAHPYAEKFRPGLAELENAMASLDQFYCQSKLEYAADMRSREHYLHEKNEILLLGEVAQTVSSPAWPLPAQRVFLQVLHLHQSPTGEAAFDELKKALAEMCAQKTTDRELARNVLFHLINYCIRRYNQGEDHYLGEQHAIFRLGLAQGLLMQDGKMTDITFTNIVMSSARPEEAEWAFHFIEGHQQFLHPKNRENCVRFSRAHLFFRKKEHKKVELLLAENGEDGLPFSFRLKLLRLKNHYELMLLGGQHKTLENICDTYAQSMRRNKWFTAEKRDAYRYFAQFLKRLIKARKRKNGQRPLVQKLGQDVRQHSKQLTMRKWLLEKIQEFEDELGGEKTPGPDGPRVGNKPGQP